MKYIISLKSLLFFLFFTLISTAIQAQSLSPEYIRNVKVANLTDAEIQKIKGEMDKQNMSMSTLENLAITNGMAPADFVVLKSRIEALTPQINETNVEKGIEVKEEVIQLDKGSIKKADVFGSEFFTNASLSFEPNSNMATPPSYILGPGDEMQIVIYGMQEYAGSVFVSKEGKITIPIVGQIFVNGLTFDAAKVQIKKACSKIYSSLASGQSQLSVSLSKIRTIRVTLIGVQKPGNYSLSSLSTVFNALHVAGGPSENGSYRKIELIRSGKVIRTIDLYKFLTKGDQTDNVNLLENDVIRVPVYENRVKIEGNVKRAGIFELLPNENFKNLLEYCGGFDEAAYRKNIKLVQNGENGIKILDMTEEKYMSYSPVLGDVFKVSSLINKFENKVSVKGSVYRPDDYEFVEGMTVLDLIKKADGLTPDAYTNRAVLVRQKEDLTKEVTDVNIASVLNNSGNIQLRKNDELVISSIFDLKNAKNVEINGYVKKPGEYPYLDNLRLYDLILLAGGFTEGASKVIEISSVIIKDEAIKNQKEYSVVQTLEIDTLLMDQAKNIMLKPFDVVQIRKKPVFQSQKSVSINGPVVYPGSYVITNNNERVLDVIVRAGGLKEEADLESIYILRQGKKIPINYKMISKNPTINRNVYVKEGDEIFIKKLDKTVKVSGNVYLSTEVPFVSGKKLKYYLSAVGGENENSDMKRIYVVYSNGLAKETKKIVGFRKYPKVKPGSEIIVPLEVAKTNDDKLSISELAIISTAVGSLSATVIALINLLSK